METPSDVMPFASLAITYSFASVCCFVLFFVVSKQKNFFAELKKANWASWVYGCSLVAMEAGYIYAYRAGWPISLASLVVNILLACLLLLIGRFFYKEKMGTKQLLGLVICLIGMFLIGQ